MKSGRITHTHTKEKTTQNKQNTEDLHMFFYTITFDILYNASQGGYWDVRCVAMERLGFSFSYKEQIPIFF